MHATLELPFNYFIQKPKNFFYGASSVAWWATLSPKFRDTTQKVADTADLVYSAFAGPDFCESIKEFIQSPNVGSLVSLGGSLVSVIEFSHVYLKIVDLGKRLPYVQFVGSMCDLITHGSNLRDRCKTVSNQTPVRLLQIMEDIIVVAQAAMCILAIVYDPTYTFSFMTIMVLDTVYLVADLSIYILTSKT